MRVEPSPARVLNTRRLPKEGTKLRVVYDLLQSNKGQPVDLKLHDRTNLHRAVDQLRNFYGMDIRVTLQENKKSKGGCYQHTLVGEHIGRDYVNYLDGTVD